MQWSWSADSHARLTTDTRDNSDCCTNDYRSDDASISRPSLLLYRVSTHFEAGAVPTYCASLHTRSSAPAAAAAAAAAAESVMPSKMHWRGASCVRRCHRALCTFHALATTTTVERIFRTTTTWDDQDCHSTLVTTRQPTDARARKRSLRTVVTRSTSRMNVRYSVSRTTRRSPMNRWRVWLTTFLFSIMIDLDLGAAQTSHVDNDKTFRLARCRVRCLASLKVSSYLASRHHTYFVTETSAVPVILSNIAINYSSAIDVNNVLFVQAGINVYLAPLCVTLTNTCSNEVSSGYAMATIISLYQMFASVIYSFFIYFNAYI